MTIRANGPGTLDTTLPIEVTHLVDTSDGYETISMEIEKNTHDLLIGDAVALRDALTEIINLAA